MADFSLSIDKLLIYDPDKSKSVCHVFITHQSPAEEKSLGKLFILTEIRSKDRINHEIINEIQEEIKHSYYNTDDLNIETAFEKALEQLNQKIADLVGNYNTNWLDKLNCIIAVIKDDTVHFSSVGTIHNFLIHNERITDIISSAGIERDRVNPLKAFTEIVSGTLSAGDSLLCCTSNLLEYLSQEKLKRTILERTPQKAVNIIENLLEENGGYTAFGAIIVRMAGEEVPVTPTIAETQPTMPSAMATPSASPQTSMERLIAKQQSTDKILAPSLTRHLFKFFTTTWSKFVNFIKIKALHQSPRRVRFTEQLKDYRPPFRETVQKKSKLTSSSKALGRGIFSIFAYLLHLIKSLPRLFKKRDKIGQELKTAPRNVSNFFSNLILGIKHLPRLSKILLLLAVVVAFILSQSIFNLGLKKESDQQNINYEQTISLISQKILKAEAAFSYGNEAGGKELLQEAQELLDELPQKKKEQKEKTKELQDNITLQLNKTKHIITIDNPVTVADFSTLEGDINAAGLVLIGGNLYTFDPATNAIYQVSINDRTISALSEKESANKFLYLTSQTNTTILFLNTANTLDEFNITSNELTSLKFSMPSQDVNIVDIDTYQSRVYLLDIKNNQIYRSPRVGNGYGTPANWLKDETIDLRNSKSMTIDGSIYILKENGEVYKLFGGNKQDWSLNSIDPALTKADKIFTQGEGDNIFILDIQGQRLVEFDKNGQLVNQYTSNTFNNLKDFSVSYPNKKLYVLNEKKIFEIDIQ